MNRKIGQNVIDHLDHLLYDFGIYRTGYYWNIVPYEDKVRMNTLFNKLISLHRILSNPDITPVIKNSDYLWCLLYYMEFYKLMVKYNVYNTK